MHELSIALSIIEGVEEEIARRDGARVATVHLKCGLLSGVVKEALLFSYGLACEGTALDGSTLQIEDMPVVLFCPACGQERPAVSFQNLCCAACGAASADIRSGRELEIVALELTDEHATTEAG